MGKTANKSTGSKSVKASIFYEILPVLLCGLTVPLSIFLWLGNLSFTFLTTEATYHDDGTAITPTRLLFAVLMPALLMLYGLRRKGLDRGGAALGLVVATTLAIASHAFFACLATFFFTSSRATKFRSHRKRKIESDFKGGEGKRNWLQVLCNGGMATQLALLYLLDCGSCERPIDFGAHYRSSWLGIGIMSAFACCNGDTWASEIGSVVGSTDPVLITNGKRVPRGTNGGVTVIGLAVSFIGGILIGIAYYLVTIFTVDADALSWGPPQWPVIVFGGVAGLLGSVIDSLLGATLQYSGLDAAGRVIELSGVGVKHISGVRLLDNHSVNLISSILTALIMPFIALALWP